jgi:hypothetical protein
MAAARWWNRTEASAIVTGFLSAHRQTLLGDQAKKLERDDVSKSSRSKA